MLINYNLLIKFFITVLTICLGAYFLYLGYMSLNLYKSINPNHSNSKTNIDVEKNYYLRKPDDAELTYESKKNQIIIENEIIIEIKKNDTFSKVINPYFQNNIIKNKIINKLNKEYNLKISKLVKKFTFIKIVKKLLKKL